MKSENVVKEKSLRFAIRMVKFVRYLNQKTHWSEQIICHQILKSGTSIGANVREAEHAESTTDFIHKLKIALKEANETEYWLRILYETNYITSQEFESMNSDCAELNKLLIAIITNLNKKNN